MNHALLICKPRDPISLDRISLEAELGHDMAGLTFGHRPIHGWVRMRICRRMVVDVTIPGDEGKVGLAVSGIRYVILTHGDFV